MKDKYKQIYGAFLKHNMELTVLNGDRGFVLGGFAFYMLTPCDEVNAFMDKYGLFDGP